MQAASDKGEIGFNGPKAEVFLVNEKDRPYFDEKCTPRPIGTFLQPIKFSGLMEKVAKKTYIRVLRFANPV
jgi:hypothetical protein